MSQKELIRSQNYHLNDLHNKQSQPQDSYDKHAQEKIQQGIQSKFNDEVSSVIEFKRDSLSRQIMKYIDRDGRQYQTFYDDYGNELRYEIKIHLSQPKIAPYHENSYSSSAVQQQYANLGINNQNSRGTDQYSQS